MTSTSRVQHDKHGRRKAPAHSHIQVRKSSRKRDKEADNKRHEPRRCNSPGMQLPDAERSETSSAQIKLWSLGLTRVPHTECLILRLRKAGNKDKTARTLATIGDQPVRREASGESRGGLGGPVVVTTRKSKYEGAVPKSRGTLS